ncbi:TPA: hypothetical protein EYP37_09790, partial [Candidatus Poribacteria bacterium]|nr:hypothetical protein [Candidatus Poribacteria bacterium]
QKGFKQIISELENDVSPPLHYFLLHIWMKLFGSGELSTRAFAALFGILLIPAIYWVGRSLFDRKVALISSFIAAIARFHIRYSQEVRMYSMLSLLGLLSVYMLYRAVKTGSKVHWMGYILLTILTIYTHNYGLFIAISGIVFFALLHVKRRTNLKEFLIAQGVIGAVYLPWMPILILKHIPSSAIVGWIPRMRLYHVYETFKIYGGVNFELFGSPADRLISGFGLALFICPFIAGILPLESYIKRRFRVEISDELLLLLCYLFVTLAIPMLISLKKPIYLTSRYSIAAWPAFPLLVGVGLCKLKKIGLLAPALFFILAVSSVSLYWHYFLWVKSHDDRSIAEYIRSRAGEEDLLVFVPSWIDIPINYYLRAPIKGVGYPWASGREPADEIEGEKFPRKPERVLELVKSKLRGSRGKVFLVYQDSITWVEGMKEVKKLLEESFSTVEVKRFYDIEITVYN